MQCTSRRHQLCEGLHNLWLYNPPLLVLSFKVRVRKLHTKRLRSDSMFNVHADHDCLTAM